MTIFKNEKEAVDSLVSSGDMSAEAIKKWLADNSIVLCQDGKDLTDDETMEMPSKDEATSEEPAPMFGMAKNKARDAALDKLNLPE